MQLTDRESAIILVCLRECQDIVGMTEKYAEHFDEDDKPMTRLEIDELCEKVNFRNEDEDLRVKAANELAEALRWICRCASIRGPVGTTAYIISDRLINSAKAALKKAGVAL